MRGGKAGVREVDGEKAGQAYAREGCGVRLADGRGCGRGRGRGLGWRQLVAAATAVLLAALCLGGCGGGGAPAPKEAKTIKIGVALSMTGGFSREGTLMKQGYEFWRDKVNAGGGIKVGNDSYQVELIMYDDKSDTNTSVKLTEKLITEDKVNFIFGPYSSGITQATSAICEKYRMLNFAVNANAPALYERGFKYIFGMLPLASAYLHAVLEFAAAQDPKPQSVAIITPDQLFAISVADGAKAKAEELGFQVVYYEKYPANIKDLSSVLAQVKAKKPDILLTTGYFQDGTLVVKQLKDLQWRPKLLGFSIAAAIPEFRSTLGADAEYVMGAEWWTPNMRYQDTFFGTARQYGDEFKAKYGYDPTYHAGNASAAGYVLHKAIEAAGSLDAEKIRQALLQLDLQTFFGRVKFDEAGRNTGGQSVAFQVRNGEILEVWPEAYARGKGIYPMPASPK